MATETIKENNMNHVLYEERGGGIIGFMGVQASWPFIKISIYDDKVTFGIYPKEIELPYTDIDAVKRLGHIPIICDGVIIRHHNKNVPKLLIFWSVTGGGKKIVTLIREQISTRNKVQENV